MSNGNSACESVDTNTTTRLAKDIKKTAGTDVNRGDVRLLDLYWMVFTCNVVLLVYFVIVMGRENSSALVTLVRVLIFGFCWMVEDLLLLTSSRVYMIWIALWCIFLLHDVGAVEKIYKNILFTNESAESTESSNKKAQLFDEIEREKKKDTNRQI